MQPRFRLERRLLAAVLVLACISSALLLRMDRQAAVPAAALAGARAAYLPVIDAGHGGEDGGAVSVSGVCESVINLDISLKMQQIFALFGVNPVLTRTSDTIDYPADAVTVRQRKVADQRARVAQIHDVPNAYLISIHQNNYPSSGPFGAQVLYAPTEESREFALYLQDLLVRGLNNGNYRSAAQISSDIYLMNQVECPAVLVECGFLSNPEEDALLQTDSYRLKLAALITAGFLRFHAESAPAYGWRAEDESQNGLLLYAMRQ